MERANTNLTIIELMNIETGQREYANDLFSKGEEFSFNLRSLVLRAITAGEPIYACGHCGQPVKIAAPKLTKTHHSFHFKHYYKSGDCPIKTDSAYTREQVQCMKYNGAKESTAHIELKHYIAEHLRISDRFTDVKVEKVIKGSGWSKEWKKPDISAQFNGKPVVFEIQLSTTFVDVIISREDFYQRNGIAIFWIFQNLDPATARATEKDVYFNNKANALSVDDDSKKITIERKELMFTGHFKKPLLDPITNNIQEHWNVMPIGFGDFDFDEVTYKPYFISFESQHNQALAEQRAEQIRVPLEKFETLALNDDPPLGVNRDSAYHLRTVGLYDDDAFDWGFLKLVKALLSFRDGVVYFPNQKGKWNWVINYIWQTHLDHWKVLLYMAKVYDPEGKIFNKDNHKLKKKRDEFEAGWKARDIRFAQNSTYYPLFEALLPELKGKLVK